MRRWIKRKLITCHTTYKLIIADVFRLSSRQPVNPAAIARRAMRQRRFWMALPGDGTGKKGMACCTPSLCAGGRKIGILIQTAIFLFDGDEFEKVQACLNANRRYQETRSTGRHRSSKGAVTRIPNKNTACQPLRTYSNRRRKALSYKAASLMQPTPRARLRNRVRALHHGRGYPLIRRGALPMRQQNRRCDVPITPRYIIT